jgi:hypothetical protein
VTEGATSTSDGGPHDGGAPAGGPDAGGWAPSHQDPATPPPGSFPPFGAHQTQAPPPPGFGPEPGFSYGLPRQPSYPPAGTYPDASGAYPPYGQPGYGAPYQPGYAPYGQSGYAAVGYGAAPSRTNGLAIASFVCALVGIIPWIGLITATLAIILGFVARSQIKATGGYQRGAQMAMAGISISISLFAIWFVIIALFFSRHVS